MVQSCTRIMNQLQTVALNEGHRYKKRLWREAGRKQLEAFRLAPWASQRRRDLLELLDRLTPTIAKFSERMSPHGQEGAYEQNPGGPSVASSGKCRRKTSSRK